MTPSAHTNAFMRNHLLAVTDCSEPMLDGFDHPDRLNAACEFTDAMVNTGLSDNTALIGNVGRRTCTTQTHKAC